MKTDNTINLMSRIREKANSFLLKALAEEGVKDLAPSHGDILAALFRRDEATMKEIAVLIHRDKSTVTQLVRKLERKGYIFCNENPADRRSSIVRLTERGTSLKGVFKKLSEDLYKMEYQGMTDEEIRQFRSLLNKVHENF